MRGEGNEIGTVLIRIFLMRLLSQFPKEILEEMHAIALIATEISMWEIK